MIKKGQFLLEIPFKNVDKKLILWLLSILCAVLHLIQLNGQKK